MHILHFLLYIKYIKNGGHIKQFQASFCYVLRAQRLLTHDKVNKAHLQLIHPLPLSLTLCFSIT